MASSPEVSRHERPSGDLSTRIHPVLTRPLQKGGTEERVALRENGKAAPGTVKRRSFRKRAASGAHEEETMTD